MYKNLRLLSILILGWNMSAFAQGGGVTTYSYTGSVQTYTVPRGVTKITVSAQGAEGGLNSSETTFPDRPGYGACVFDTLTVTVGQVVNIVVGGQGANGTISGTIAGGYNGGGNGANNTNSLGGLGPGPYFGGGAGGGASDVRVGGLALASRVIVAAGGGGAGVHCATTSTPNVDRGGDGGNLIGETGAACSGTTGGGGGSTTGSTGGGGGSCSTCSGLSGSAGAVGNGGNAGICCGLGLGSAGGGGGGGYYGGGGGDWTGGGGGSSKGSSTAVMTRGCNSSGNGQVVIAPVCMTPGITGHMQVCFGLTDTLYDDTTGGVWSSADGGSIVSIDPTTGILTGVSAGSTIITYVVGPCYTTTVFTVNPLPTTTTGADSVCAGLNTTLASIDGPGTWSSSNTAVGTVGSGTGVVTGVSFGTTIITYRLTLTGCINTTIVQVDSLPAPITGTDTVCAGLTTTYSDITSAGVGTWSSSNMAVGTVDAISGVILGISAGTSLITYTVPMGACMVTAPVIVYPLPNPITGADTVCVASSTTLSDASSGGSWSNSMGTTIITIGTSSGIVTGVLAGSTIITYTLHTGCLITDTFLVHPLPSVIFGIDSVCVGSTVTLTNDSVGGTWSSSNAGWGSIDPISGVVTGISSGHPIITYLLPTSCLATITMTVNPLPGAITGADSVCSGLTTTLSDISTGGTWSSSDMSTATVNSTTGVVTGVTTGIVDGTATITYTLSTGCLVTTSMVVHPLAPITGTAEICRFSSTTLADFVPGGSWISGNTAVGTVDPGTGIVYGVGAGTTIITYQISATNCSSYYTVRVDSFSNITGALTVCQGDTVHMADSVSIGVWSTSNTAIGSIDPVTGIVTGVSAGVDTITYTLASACNSYFTQTVYPSTRPYGDSSICEGYTTTLIDSTAGGGTWTSTSSLIAVGYTSGLVYGFTEGTAIVTFTTGSGCVTFDTVIVQPLTPIVGMPSVCVGSMMTLSDATGGGVWSLTDGSLATIGSSSGTVTGLAPGTTSITYSLGSGCSQNVTLTVYPLPARISGADSVCVGSTVTLTDASFGGFWNSGNLAVAHVGLGTGIVLGISQGTAIITYTTTGNCYTLDTVTVHPLPASIVGSHMVCTGSTISLTDGTSGGSWSSDNISAGSIDGLGNVLGEGTGVANITYTLSTGCYATISETDNPLPAAIGGPDTVCSGQTITATDITSGGSWISSNTLMVTINSSSGLVTGIEAGSAIITFQITSTGCIKTETVVVDSLDPIVGPSSICASSLTDYTEGVTGGTWSSTNTSVATVGSTTGIVDAVFTGTTTIICVLSTGCTATITVTVNPIPGVPIATLSPVCEGLHTTLRDLTGGGSWISGDVGVATVGTGSGFVTAVSPGTAIITYMLMTTGCYNTTTVTVFSLAPITGPDSVCSGGSVTLGDTASGGTWSSSNTAVGSIGSTTGIVTTGVAGTSIISYTLGSGCQSSRIFTVNPLPFAISGATVVCEHSTISLTDVTGTGTWSSSDGSVATINSGGVLTGVSGGTVTITYMLGTGCYSTMLVTVNPVPDTIRGGLNICQFGTSLLTDDSVGGTWSTSDGSIGNISSSGLLTGVSGGTAVITYTLPTGCYSVIRDTVNPVPAIVGPFNVCSGFQITLTDGVTGGTWLSGDIAVATIGTGIGVVTGIYVGLVAATATITYEMPSGCVAYAAVTVNPNPAPITFTSTVVCQGQSIDFFDATLGGGWSGSNGAVGFINPVTGVLTGVGGGSLTITYKLPTGCYSTVTGVVVNPVTPILGGNNVCLGSTITLTDATGGGTWLSSNTVVATIGTGTGLVTGISPGTCTITWLLSTGCSATESFTVNPLPTISGPTTVCGGQTITLTGNPPGVGNWTSGNVAVATVGFGTGVVTGQFVGATGTAIITYRLPTSCYMTYTVTVNPSPAAITGPPSVCVGSGITLTESTVGGTWMSSNTVVGTVGSIGFPNTNFQGMSVGTCTVSYILSATGCFTTKIETVNSLPSGITAITSFTVCAGSNITLHDASFGGTWASGNTLVATVGSTTGIVTGVSAGTALISYVLGTNCFSTATVTVLPLPGALITPLSDTNICPGGFVALTASTDTGAIRYQWAKNGIGITGATSSSYIDTVAGIFTVTVTQTATTCSSISSGMRVTVASFAAVNTATVSTTTCSGVGVTMTAVPANMGYQWEFDGSAIIGATNSVYTATATGVYEAVVTNTVGCSFTTNTITTSINPSPPGIITLSGPITFCNGGSVRISADSVPGTSYQWYVNGAAISDVSTSYTAVTSGTVSLSETNSFGCTTVSANVVVVVKPLPLDNVSASGLLTFCPGGSVTLTAPTGGGETYQWYVGGVAISGATGRNLFVTTTGNYQLKVDSNGCTNMGAATAVAELTTPTIIPLTPASFCWGGNAYLSAGIVGGATGVVYSWYFNDVLIPGATASTYIAGVPGEYKVAISLGACFVDGDSVAVTEKPLPNPIVTYSVSVFHTQSYFTSYQWYNTTYGGAIPGAVADTLIATGNGTYKVDVTDTNGCHSFSDNYVLTDWVPNPRLGIVTAGTYKDIRIYPNPAQNTVHIDAPVDVRAEITSIDGKVLLVQANATDIDISRLADGVYFIMLYDSHGVKIKTDKLLKATR